jgi:outer membrane receptor protein involved in Fe transport
LEELMANRNIARAVRLALIAAGTTGAGIYAPGSVAQEAELEQIVVTGSRIQRQDFESASPIVSLSSETFDKLGVQNAETLINTMPQVVPSFSTGNNNPGGGQAFINLRGLGAVRNLVLVDGKRMTPGNESGIVDINTIPTGLIERVEIISGGASAVYGSDAVAGAVNFILKDNFNGVEIDGQYGLSEQGDAGSSNVNITMGSDFAEGRGNAVLFASYDDRDELTKGEREFSKQAVSLTSFFPQGGFFAGPNGPSQAAVDTLFQSYGVAPGRVLRNDTFSFNQDGTIFATSASAATVVENFRGDPNSIDVASNFFPGRYSYNFEPWNKLIIPQERVSLGAQANYEITDNAEAYTRMLFTNYSSSTSLAPSPAPTGNNFTNPAAGAFFTLPVTNPFVQANPDLLALMNSRTGDNAALAGSGAAEDIIFRRRFVESGPRVESYERDTYQILVGTRGDITDNWSFDVYGAHGKYNSMENQDGNISVTAVERLLDAPDGGQSLCAGGFDPIGAGTLSPECAKFVTVLAKNTVTLEQNLAEATVSGDLFNLPAGAVSSAFGAFWQEQMFEFLPDSILSSGDVAGFNAQDEIIGRVSNTDLFAELYFPLVKDLPGVQNLGLTVGYRYSDHSNSGESDSYKAELDWTVIDAVRVRGSYQRAVRAPNIGELFSPQQEDNPEVTDPCNADSAVRSGPDAAAARALCLAQGVPAAIIDTYQQTTDQIDALAGGNPDLGEETADTYTAGIVWRPGFSDRLSMSLDYYNIEIADVISAIDPSIVASRCFNQDGANPTFTQNNFYCALFGRDSIGQIQDLLEIQNNLAILRTDGIDLQLDYGFEMGTFGDLGINLVGNYVFAFEEQQLPGDKFQDFVGTIGNAPGETIPEWKATLSLTWNIATVSTQLRARFLPSMDHEETVVVGSKDPEDCGCTGVDSITYLDLTASWQPWEAVTLRFGVENLTDEDPELYDPQVDSGTDPSTYDVVGRRYFMAATYKF